MNKPVLIGLVILSLSLSGSGAVFGIPRVQAYLQANEHEKKGDNYFNQKQYEEALSAYKLSKERFSDRTIEDKISLSNQLSQDEGHYNNGNNAIEQESWGTAIKELSLVSQKSDRYDAASKLVSYATEKLNADAKKEKILGEKDEANKLVNKEDENISASLPPVQTESILVDPNPIVDCYRNKCGTKKITKSACDVVVCCEIKNDVFKWTVNEQECSSLEYENGRVPETKPLIIVDNLDKSKTLEAERKASEAEKKASEVARCQRLTEVYSNCIEDFYKSMDGYTNCQKDNDDAMQRYNDEMQKYSKCMDSHNDKLEDYNEIEWEYSEKMKKLKQEQVMKDILSSGVGAKARQELTDYYERKLKLLKDSLEIVCFKPSSPQPEYCSKPTNRCTKPYCY